MKKISFLLIAMGLFFVIPLSAGATETVGTTVITGGELTLDLGDSTINFPDTTLDGTIKTISAQVPSVTITDATGIGDGWQLLVNATPFVEKMPVGGFKPGTKAKTFTNETLTIKPNAITPIDGGLLTGVTLNTARQNIVGGDVVIATATKGNGLGKYVIDFGTNPLELQLLHKAYVDLVNYPTGGTVYESTLTWKVVVAP